MLDLVGGVGIEGADVNLGRVHARRNERRDAGLVLRGVVDVVGDVEGEPGVEVGGGDREGVVMDRILRDGMGGDVVESGLGGELVDGKIVGWDVEAGAGMGKHLYGTPAVVRREGWREGGGERRRRGGRREEGLGRARDRGRNVCGRDWQVVRYAYAASASSAVNLMHPDDRTRTRNHSFAMHSSNRLHSRGASPTDVWPRLPECGCGCGCGRSES